MSKGKRLRDFICKSKYNRLSSYPLKQAILEVSKVPPVSFDETMELSVNFLKLSKAKNLSIKSFCSFPHSFSVKRRVCVFCPKGEGAPDDKFGADLLYNEDDLSSISEGQKCDFDVLISRPSSMPLLASFARFLGSKGLLPNAKFGTLTDDLVGAVLLFKRSTFTFSLDKYLCLHVPFGKRSQDSSLLEENALHFFSLLKDNFPADLSIKQSLKSVWVKSTMSPAYCINFLDSNIF